MMCDFAVEMHHLKSSLQQLSAEVMAMIEKAAVAVHTLDIPSATAVLHAHAAIAPATGAIDAAALKLLTGGPQAVAEVRYLLTLVKVKGEVARIADFVADIAERVFVLVGHGPIQGGMIDFSPILRALQQMLHDAMQSFMEHRPLLARMVMLDDDIADQVDRDVHAWGGRDPKKERLLPVMTIAHAIECIADGIHHICKATLALEAIPPPPTVNR